MAVNAGEAIQDKAVEAQEALLETYENAQNKVLAAKSAVEDKFERMTTGTSPSNIEMVPLNETATSDNIAWPSLTDKAYLNPPQGAFVATEEHQETTKTNIFGGPVGRRYVPDLKSHQPSQPIP
jgi:hypothetical protein